MALVILGHIMCGIRPWWLMTHQWWAHHLKYLNWYLLDWSGWSYFSRYSTARVLSICFEFEILPGDNRMSRVCWSYLLWKIEFYQLVGWHDRWSGLAFSSMWMPLFAQLSLRIWFLEIYLGLCKSVFETCEITFGYIESLNFDIDKLYIRLGHKFLQNKLIVPKISITSQLLY